MSGQSTVDRQIILEHTDLILKPGRSPFLCAAARANVDAAAFLSKPSLPVLGVNRPNVRRETFPGEGRVAFTSNCTREVVTCKRNTKTGRRRALVGATGVMKATNIEVVDKESKLIYVGAK